MFAAFVYNWKCTHIYMTLHIYDHLYVWIVSIFVAHTKIQGLNPQTQSLFTVIMCSNISILIEVVSSGVLLPIYNI